MLSLSCITACVSVCVCMPIGLVVAVLLCGGSFREEGAYGLCHAGPEDGPYCQACGDCELSMMCLLLLTALPTPALLNAPPAAPPPPPLRLAGGMYCSTQSTKSTSQSYILQLPWKQPNLTLPPSALLPPFLRVSQCSYV